MKLDKKQYSYVNKQEQRTRETEREVKRKENGDMKQENNGRRRVLS